MLRAALRAACKARNGRMAYKIGVKTRKIRYALDDARVESNIDMTEGVYTRHTRGGIHCWRIANYIYFSPLNTKFSGTSMFSKFNSLDGVLVMIQNPTEQPWAKSEPLRPRV